MTASESKPSILIVEDDPVVCQNLALVLRMEGFEVREATNGIDGLALARGRRPDLILCDILMPGMDGHAFHAQIKDDPALHDILFIFITGLNNIEAIRKGMLAGADDYLPKPFSTKELLAAIHTRFNRAAELRRPGTARTIPEEKVAILDRISPREREVLLLVGQGATTKEIASQLFISPKTVEVHRSQLMKKLGVTNAAGLARWAALAELIEPAQT